MSTSFTIENIIRALETRESPAVTAWNRIEGRPRTTDFSRALRAEVRDALWMLARQWQLGEFRADDAGSPIRARMRVAMSSLTRYQPADHSAELLGSDAPLEARVECQPIPMTLDLRTALGRRWLKLVAPIGAYEQAFITRYGFVRPDPSLPEHALVCAHPDVWQSFAAASGRLMDGGRLYDYLTGAPGRHAYDGMTVPGVHQDDIDRVAAEFVAWCNRVLMRPARDGDAWLPARLEYQFRCGTPPADGDPVLEAEEYYQGRLDWHAFNVNRNVALPLAAGSPPDPPTKTARTVSAIPAPLSFEGMPNTRWWAFEDGRTNFAGIRPDTTDLGKLLLIEFGLVYANDWFLLPLTIPSATCARVTGLEITSVFGERFWISPAGSGAAAAWQDWSLFTLTPRGGGAPESVVLMLPTTPHVLEGEPLEEVMLMRDEIANLTWGIERTVPLEHGEPRPGREAAGELRAYFERLVAAAAPPAIAASPRAPLRYQVMTAVPENWIPFISVHKPGETRRTELQRAALPRLIEGDTRPIQKVRPRTSAMRVGLDREPPEPYFIYEEEVPRAGVRVTLAFERARWTNGRTVVWAGRRKGVGRGEGASGLLFDYLASDPPDPQIR